MHGAHIQSPCEVQIQTREDLPKNVGHFHVTTIKRVSGEIRTGQIRRSMGLAFIPRSIDAQDSVRRKIPPPCGKDALSRSHRHPSCRSPPHHHCPSLWWSYHGVEGKRCSRNFYRFSDGIQLAFMDTYRALTKGFQIARQPCSITLFKRVPHQLSADPRALASWLYTHHPTMPVWLTAHDCFVSFRDDRRCLTKSSPGGNVHSQKGKR